ncbi:uncharacterized protein LOC135302269 [Passer domesticus]|uniref:uncharacterized protein LOC135302269 n=1 Tax=Passer domesticus TaxID=48849 RepID=UPI0030FF21F0
MVLSRYLLLLFLVALPAQNAQSAPAAGQGAVVDTESALSAPERGADTVLTPSSYLKRMNDDKVPEEFPEGLPDVPEELLAALHEAPSETDSETVPETLAVEESDIVPGSHEKREPIEDTRTLAEPEEYSGSSGGQKAEAAGHCDPSKYYILVGTVAASALLLLGAVSGYVVMHQLLKRDRRSQEDKEATGQDWDSPWESCGQPRGEAESGEGAGSGERAQGNGFRDSCRLFPELFAAELAQLYKNMGADPSPLPTCSFCALADNASSQDHWISLESPQPTASSWPSYQYLQDYYLLEDDD